MLRQLRLPGLDESVIPFRPDTLDGGCGNSRAFSLFYAIFPTTEDAHRIAHVASELRDSHALGGAPLRPHRLHITLVTIASFVNTLPQLIMDAAIAASANTHCRAFRVTFDRAVSFQRSDAFVLRCSPDSDEAIARLRQPLARALQGAGLRPKVSSTPHMTMHYGAHSISEIGVAPLSWTATRFALVVSHIGRTHHQWITERRLQELD